MPTPHEALRDACTFWQSGRDGSSLLRGAARVLTGHRHYFEADFITRYEEAARKDPQKQDHARTLLTAIATSEPQAAWQWRATSPDDTLLAGRGVQSGPQDAQILDALSTGAIVMPLWGVSLDRTVAESYGGGFLFLIDGPFRGVAAWKISGDKPEDQEVITGGRYKVLDTTSVADSPHVVTLREIGPTPIQVGAVDQA